MKRDIVHPKVEGVSMAVVPEEDADGHPAWYVYLINRTAVPLVNVMVSSQGYGQLAQEQVRTSELRHYLEKLDGGSFARIERIVEEVFALNNQYWLSYYVDHILFDKRYIFLPESIDQEHFTSIPLLNKRGVLIE
jgi:uncharacterized membrane protein YhfC